MYIQSDIIIHTDIKNVINMWVTDIYNGNYSIIDCTEKEYNKFIMVMIQKMMIPNLIVLTCYEEMAHEIYLENAAENYLLGNNNNNNENAYIHDIFGDGNDSSFSEFEKSQSDFFSYFDSDC